MPMEIARVNEVDGFAMALVLILVLSFGVVALLLVSIFRNTKRRESEVEKLLDEVTRKDQTPKHPAPSAPPDTREPWEKDGDWWKK
jgi:flagellar biosynthesis/type III secretory pathway M-ring protein FliF/YscJ